MIILIVLYVSSYRWVHFCRAVLFCQPNQQLFTHSLDAKLLTYPPSPITKANKNNNPKTKQKTGGGGIRVVAVYDFSSTPYCPFQKTTTLHHKNSFSVYCPFQKKKHLAP